jgi:hypothetical protein
MKTLVVLPDRDFKANSRRQEAAALAIGARNSGRFSNVRLLLEGVRRNDREGSEAPKLSQELRFPVEGTDGKLKDFKEFFGYMSLLAKYNITFTMIMAQSMVDCFKSELKLPENSLGNWETQVNSAIKHGILGSDNAKFDKIKKDLAAAENALIGQNMLGTEKSRLWRMISGETNPEYNRLEPRLVNLMKIFFIANMEAIIEAEGEMAHLLNDDRKNGRFRMLVSPLCDATNHDLVKAYLNLEEAKPHLALVHEFDRARFISGLDFDMGILHADAGSLSGPMLNMLKAMDIGQLFIKNPGEKTFEYTR